MLEKLVYGTINLINNHNWNDSKTKEQARAMFTTICILYDIEVDTMRCDMFLMKIYNESSLENLISYNVFTDYMIELIV